LNKIINRVYASIDAEVGIASLSEKNPATTTSIYSVSSISFYLFFSHLNGACFFSTSNNNLQNKAYVHKPSLTSQKD
jgi:hypothetical protein